MWKKTNNTKAWEDSTINGERWGREEGSGCGGKRTGEHK